MTMWKKTYFSINIILFYVIYQKQVPYFNKVIFLIAENHPQIAQERNFLPFHLRNCKHLK